MRDIWGRGWDAERRSLLFQHYWSYARQAVLPSVHLPEPNTSRDASIREFAQEYARHISSVQRQSSTRRRVRLTYRPIGKNLRLLATAIRDAVDRGCATDIHPDGPPLEVQALAQRGHQWAPWLWGRNGQPSATADQAWRSLFVNPESFVGDDAPTAAPRWKTSESAGALSSTQLRRITTLAAAAGYSCAPVAAIESEITSYLTRSGWPASAPVLGLHVRRSDAASADQGAPRLSNRASFGLEHYLAAADRLCDQYGITHVFLATESEVEIERAMQLRPRYTFLTVPHDRTLFPDIAVTRQYIEELALTHPDRALPLARMAIVDLQLFRRCSAFVGAFNSEFSVLSWLMCVAGQQTPTPYISLSEPDPHLRLHPYDALLNLRNNCPLELYHW